MSPLNALSAYRMRRNGKFQMGVGGVGKRELGEGA